jgi:hypothetical protein
MKQTPAYKNAMDDGLDLSLPDVVRTHEIHISNGPCVLVYMYVCGVYVPAQVSPYIYTHQMSLIYLCIHTPISRV